MSYILTNFEDKPMKSAVTLGFLSGQTIAILGDHMSHCDIEIQAMDFKLGKNILYFYVII